ncbi:hypothetical protein [Streptomyces sp. BK79]|uniref:hypothetical protein n=1 Tax=Streptomyces sp. BK79 TaxID=3350097 RepID=UPI00376F93C6
MTVLPRTPRGMKRLFHTLLLTTATLTENLWLLGTGAWTLITALLIDLVYRP